MRYFEIVKQTIDTLSAATATSDAEDRSEQTKSVRPKGVERDYPSAPLNGATPPPGLREIVPQGCQVLDAERVKSSEHADGIGLLERGHPIVAGQQRIEILDSALPSLLRRHGLLRSRRFRQSQSVGFSRSALRPWIESRPSR